MKIQVKAEGRDIKIFLPTNLVFSRGTAWLANHAGRVYAEDALKDIPPEALEALFAEIRRIKRRYGSWELVEVRSADGEVVNVTL